MRNDIIVQKMLRMINTIQDYCKDSDYSSFSENSMLVEACVFNLSQMGALVAKIDADFEKEHTEIQWRQIYGLRNRIVHDYEGVNLKLVWQIIQEDLPELKESLEAIKFEQ